MFNEVNIISCFYLLTLSTLLSFFICFLVKVIFKNLKILDIPNTRSSHDKPVILSGGVGFLLTLGLITLFIYPKFIFNNVIVVLGLCILFFVSLYDDLKQISNKIRFFIHFIVGNIFFFSNIKLLSIHLWLIDIPLNIYASYFCTIFFVISLINIYNFMDGIDGYAGGVGVLASAFFGVSFLLIQNHYLALICFSLSGVLLGFLFFNFPLPKAKMFMGDVGSAVLGAIFAMLSLKYSMYSNEFSHSIIIPMMVLGVFICDASITIFIRSINGENIFKAHRSHFYQKLNIFGWSHKKILILEYSHILLCIGLVYLCINLDLIFTSLTLFILSFILKFIYIHKKINYKSF